MLPVKAIVSFIDDTDPNVVMGYGTWTPVLPNADDGAVLLSANPENGPAAGDQGWIISHATGGNNEIGRSDATHGGITVSGYAPIPWICVKVWKRVA